MGYLPLPQCSRPFADTGVTRPRCHALKPQPRTSGPRPPNAFPWDALLALACAGLACWVHRRALTVYFHPDDLISMEWARGLLPSPDFGLWRLLSGKLYFGAALAAFGTDPFPYHALNIALHMANVVLLYALARRFGASRASATLAAGLFGTARPAFSVLQQAVGIGELLALGLGMGALLLCERRTLATRVGAVFLMLAALLSKEAVLLLPLVLLLPREPGTWRNAGAWRERFGVAMPLLIVMALAALTLVIGNVRGRAFGGEAYAMGLGAETFHNLMTYAAWVFDIRNPFFDDPGGISHTAWRVGLPAMAVLVGLALWSRTRTRVPVVGLVWAAATLAPVLPLLHHTYANYLYAPLAGLALALGTSLLPSGAPAPSAVGAGRTRGGVKRAQAPATRGYAIAAIVAVVLLAHANASTSLLDARIARRYEGIDLPFDRQLRKSDMIRRATEGLQRTAVGSPRRVVLYTPPQGSNRLDQRTGEVIPDSTLTLEQMLMYRVLDGGRALRALTPGLDSVAFVEHWSAEYAEFDLCANAPAGDIVDFGPGPEGLAKLGQLLLGQRSYAIAIDLLTPACAAFPEDARLRQLLEQAQATRQER